MPCVPASKGRSGPRPRRPGSARLRIPSVGGLRQTEKERTPTATKVDLVRTTDGPRRPSNKITIYGWSTSTTAALRGSWFAGIFQPVLTGDDLAAWVAGLDDLFALVAGRFGRVEPRRRARAYVRGLLAPLAVKNGWTLAEAAGDATPDGMQRLLNAAEIGRASCR